MKKAIVAAPPQDPSLETTRNRKAKNGNTNGQSNTPPNNLDLEHDLDAAQILGALVAIKRGDFTARLPLTLTGTSG
ncbi:MAG TPA: hypothetical protein VK850_02225, partial [Candidatus Binatia bacterium]|nr:hypothetical protein [Candidatus Binatia bacterium]